MGNFDPPQSLGIDGFSPTISGDGLTLYYTTTSAPRILRSISRDSIGGLWNPPEDVMPTEYLHVEVSGDELRLLLSDGPNGGFPLPPVAVATRTAKRTSFGSPVPIDSFTLAGDTAFGKSAHWDAAERVIYATYNLPSGQGGTDLYISACR